MAIEGFFGTGWSFPLGVNPRGGIAVKSASENIRDSIAIIINTRPGERAMRPDFGCSIDEFVFAPASAGFLGTASFLVRRALELWEPRIVVQRVDAKARDGRIEIEVEYTERATNREDNVVVPYYVTEAV